MVTVCCVCNKLKTEAGWVDQDYDETQEISHGYCPICALKLRVEIEALRSMKLQDIA